MERFEMREGDDDPLADALDPANVLPARIAAWARTDPDRPFLVEAASGRAASYGACWDLARRWATVLHGRGVGAGDRVATLLPSSIDAHAVWLACALLRAYEVPINPELRGEFLDHVLADAAITHCVARPEHATVIGGASATGIDVVVADADASPAALVAPIDAGPAPTPDDVSCVIYTSGTTGPAKGVVISWAQMSANLGRLPRRWLSDTDAVYSPWPMFHVTGRSPMVSMSDVGGRVVLRERFSLPDFWRDVREFGCTSTTIGAVVPLLLAQPERPDDADHPLRLVLFGKVGGEGHRFLRRFGTAGVTFYGSTEVGFPIANRPVADGDEDGSGWPRPGYAARIVDAAGDEVVPGQVGELWIHPPDRRLILREYLGRPQLTAEAVVDGWYRTGDAVRRRPEDGAFVFVDRIRDTIRRFGENISSSALENAVLRDDAVLECAAVGVPSPIAGQDVLLLVTTHPGTAPDAAALARRLAGTLPRYMRPSYVAVVDALPHTPNGKVRKVDLPATIDLAAAPSPTFWKERT